jgi:hypothetical protein
VIVTRHQSGNCACSVLKLESVIYNKTQKRCAQVRVLIGSSCRELVAVALSFALENQREVFKSALRSRLFDLARVLNDDLYRFRLPRGEISFASLKGKRGMPSR